MFGFARRSVLSVVWISAREASSIARAVERATAAASVRACADEASWTFESESWAASATISVTTTASATITATRRARTRRAKAPAAFGGSGRGEGMVLAEDTQ